MTNLARGGVILTLVLMTFAFFLSETETDAALIIANDSKGNIQQNDETDNNHILTTENNFSAIKNNQKEIIVNIEDFDASFNSDNSDQTNAKSSGKASGTGFVATAYCLQGKTATGGSVRRGIVAADPKILPLGTRITMNAGAYSGSYVVADTGGGIKGKRLDVWVSSCSEAKRFGRKSVSVNVGGK